MAAASFHARSNSLPARSHPLISEIDEQICRLRQSQAASTSSSSSIGHNLNSLQVVYDCVDQLFQLSSTQQALINDQKCFNELLDGSLRLLDLCNTAKDALSQMKESVAELQSAIRRRQGGMEGETRRYLKSRKTVIKAIQKVLKGMENKKSTSSNNVETTSSKPSSWSLFKRVASASSENEFADVDASLKTNKSNEEVQLHLKNLQPCIQDLEEGVESLFRRLIKTRASILTIHNL
ncbi:unnamed protein product [Linum tenue]|uniref:Uncharacterized protein n=1 Tax=Linum tenue TaxID=586396 RepID=A0AAV0PE73_9ROSI|nr:unnamed protein product [Linum tenue]